MKGSIITASANSLEEWRNENWELNLPVAEALHGVVVHHPRRLHECVADGRPHKGKAAFFEALADRVGFRRAGRQSLSWLPGIHARLAANKLPDVAIERSEFLLHCQECLGILHGGRDLKAVADDAPVAHQGLQLSPIITANPLSIEDVEIA